MTRQSVHGKVSQGVQDAVAAVKTPPRKKSTGQRGSSAEVQCNDLWPQFITDASVMPIIGGKREEQNRAVRAFGEVRRERWAQTLGNATRKGEELRPLPVKSGEGSRGRRALSTVAACGLPYVHRMHCSSHPLHLTSPHVALILSLSFSERPDRTQNPDPRTLTVDFECTVSD